MGRRLLDQRYRMLRILPRWYRSKLLAFSFSASVPAKFRIQNQQFSHLVINICQMYITENVIKRDEEFSPLLNSTISPSSFNFRFENCSRWAWAWEACVNFSEHGLEEGRRFQDSDPYKQAQKSLQDILEARTASQLKHSLKMLLLSIHMRILSLSGLMCTVCSIHW